MKRILLWLIVAAALVIGFVFYRSRSGSNLNVTPDAEGKSRRPSGGDWGKTPFNDPIVVLQFAPISRSHSPDERTVAERWP